jgi:hypothetical protein
MGTAEINQPTSPSAARPASKNPDKKTSGFSDPQNCIHLNAWHPNLHTEIANHRHRVQHTLGAPKKPREHQKCIIRALKNTRQLQYASWGAKAN